MERTVLIIEDEKLIIVSTQMVLEAAGFRVESATNGEDGFAHRWEKFEVLGFWTRWTRWTAEDAGRADGVKKQSVVAGVALVKGAFHFIAGQSGRLEIHGAPNLHARATEIATRHF